MSPLFILALIGIYFLVWGAVSWCSSRGADSATFFSANRKMPWPLVAVAMLGAPITGITFISVPGMVMTKGLSYIQMCMGFFVGYLVIAFLLIPLYYRLNIVSIYGYLRERFGISGYRMGAWLFFISKIMGISIRFLIVCAMLQLLVFAPLGIPYYCCVLVSLALVWLSTFRGGVRSVIWGDVLKSVCLTAAIALCIWFVLAGLDLSGSELAYDISARETSRIFFFDDASDGKYFWKQFVGGIFIVIAMTGLDQDMMQRTLACRDAKASAKNLITASLLQTLVISCLLLLGLLMLIFVESHGLPLPEKSDNLFASVAFHHEFPWIVGAFFIIGLVSATFSSVASALTSMTTTVSVDIIPRRLEEESVSPRRRTLVHTSIAVLMALIVIFFYYLNQDDAISTVYTLISYTDGPILGLFAFGLFTNRRVNGRLLPFVCLLSPVLAWGVQQVALHYFNYVISFELLIINAFFTFAGMWLLSPLKSAAGQLSSS